MVLAIFDVDHTLVRADSLKLFGLFLCKRKGIRLSRLVAFVGCLLGWCLWAADTEKLKATYVKMLCGGLPMIDVSVLAREFTQRLLFSKAFPEALDRIRRHKAEGYEIVLLSASLDIYLEVLAELIGAQTLICTKLSTQNGFLTGDLLGANCKGQEKLRRLLEQYGEHNIDWKRSCAYSDSSSDLPVLERVGTVVAVNPDRRLARVALERQWQVEYWH